MVLSASHTLSLSLFLSLALSSPFTPEEDVTIQQAFETYGNRWTQIAELLPGRTEDAVKLRWKSLNPNVKSSARPGRPKTAQGTGVKPRSMVPPNPDEIAAAIMAPLPAMTTGVAHAPYPEPGYAPTSYDYSSSPAYAPANPNLGGMTPMPAHAQQHPPPHQQQMQSPHQQQQMQSTYHQHMQSPHHQHMQSPHHQHLPAHHPPPPQPVYAQPPPARSQLPSDLPEPIVEPQETKEEVESKDAAILKELLRSFSNSLMSFEGSSSRGLTSISDMSPEDLLASGELDEMLRMVSLANRPSGAAGSSFRMSGRTSRSSSKSSFHHHPSSSENPNTMDSFSQAVQSMGREEKNMFQGLIDQLRANGGGVGGNGNGAVGYNSNGGGGGGGHLEPSDMHHLPMDSGLFTSFSSNSAKNLLNLLDYDDDGSESDSAIARSSTIGLSPAVVDATSEIDDLFDPSVMRTIRKGKVQY